MNDILKATLEAYEQNNAPKKKSSNSYDKSSYFGVQLPKGVNEKTFRIRILPPLEGDKLFWQEQILHSWKIGNKYPKYVCPKEHGDSCPICDARDALYAEGSTESKNKAYDFRNKKQYILRVIDRENEADGVKFWRFGHNSKKTGVMDKIVSVIKSMEFDITDIKTGLDLSIDVARDGSNPYVCNVTSILPKLPQCELSTDAAQADKWLADQRTWKDGIWGVKSYDFLKLVTIGKTPVWSKEKETYVSEEDVADEQSENSRPSDEVIVMGGGNSTPQTSVDKIVSTPSPQPSQPSEPTNVGTTTGSIDLSDEDDDLPF